MLYSTNTAFGYHHFGIEESVEQLINAGFPALDFTFSLHLLDNLFDGDWQARFKRLRAYANEHGVIFNQAHAPHGGGYDVYIKTAFEVMPKVFEAAALLGVDNVIVHPLQKGRYYGNEEELFQMNMAFYSKLAVFAKNVGVKISLENMWQTNPTAHYIVNAVCADPFEMNKYYDTLNDPSVFNVCLDIGHVAICNMEPENAIRIIGKERLGALHVHDVDYCHDSHVLPGMQKINWNNVCRALAEVDYQGVFTLECEYLPVNYDKEFMPTLMRFANDTAKYYANKVDLYRGATE